jgi:hypothetical protein
VLPLESNSNARTSYSVIATEFPADDSGLLRRAFKNEALFYKTRDIPLLNFHSDVFVLSGIPSHPCMYSKLTSKVDKILNCLIIEFIIVIL